MPWLVAGEHIVASLEIAETRRSRRRGLLGRDGIEGALLIDPVRAVHTMGMKFAIDVAHLDADHRVISVVTMAPNRMGRPRWRARTVLEAEADSLRHWGIEEGVCLEVRE